MTDRRTVRTLFCCALLSPEKRPMTVALRAKQEEGGLTIVALRLEVILGAVLEEERLGVARVMTFWETSLVK